MEANQNNVSARKRRNAKFDFWFLTSIIVSNFLLYFLRILLESNFFLGSFFAFIIGAAWFPVLLGILLSYIIFRLAFLEKTRNVAVVVVATILLQLLPLAGFFIFMMTLGSGHGGPLDFLLEKHLQSLFVVTLILLLPYIISIVRILRLKQKNSGFGNNQNL